MTHKKEFGGTRWRLERVLSVFDLVITHLSERSSACPLMGSFALSIRSALAWSPYVTSHRS